MGTHNHLPAALRPLPTLDPKVDDIPQSRLSSSGTSIICYLLSTAGFRASTCIDDYIDAIIQCKSWYVNYDLQTSDLKLICIISWGNEDVAFQGAGGSMFWAFLQAGWTLHQLAAQGRQQLLLFSANASQMMSFLFSL